VTLARLLDILRGGVAAAALQEAAGRDHLAVAELIRGALRNAWKLAGDVDTWPYVKALYDDGVVVEKDGKLMRFPYTLGEEAGALTISLGAPVQVMPQYVPVAEMTRTATVTEAFAPIAGGGAFLEAAKAADKPTGRFRVRIIRAGLSGNGNYYPDAVLREAAPRFEGARVIVKADDVHLASKGKDPRAIIGALSDVAFVEAAGRVADAGELIGTLTLIDPSEPFSVKLTEAVGRGMGHLFGLSIDARGKVRKATVGGRPVVEAVSITKVNSVDVIVEPGAGGAVLGLLEAAGDIPHEDPMRDKIIAKIKAKRPELLKGLDEATLTEAQLDTLLDQALTEAAPAEDPTTKAVRLIEARNTVRERVGRSTLPQAARDRITAELLARDDVATLTEAQIEERIKTEATYLVGVGAGQGAILGNGGLGRIEAGESRFEKTQTMLEAFFDREHKDHRHAQSFRAIYQQITGDQQISGDLGSCDEALLRESLGTSGLTNILGIALTRQMVAVYNSAVDYQIWRQAVSRIVPLADFRTQERVRFGSYADLVTVSERAPYPELASPTDEKATYAPAKRGGIETITREAILADDVGFIREIPLRIGRAAQRTLAKFVLDFYRTNPVIYDGQTYFHASHGNLGTAALDATGYADARLAFVKQAEYGGNDLLGVQPRILWIPWDLERTARDLFVRNTNNDPTFVNSLNPTIIPVWYWTDTNDWVIQADARDIPNIEVGFVQGQEQPQLLVQDAPNQGSLFYNDTMSWKVRHEYGATVLDWRGARKHVVP
jgi:hypothetical protein